MQILKSERFHQDLKEIVAYIAEDSPESARNFLVGLEQSVEGLALFPYRFRRSIFFEEERIRDLIYRGYVIPYEVWEEERRIVILGIVKYRKGF